MKNYDMIQNVIGLIIVILAVIAMNCFLVVLMWRGIRSIFKKTLNLSPSRRKWARMRADVIRDDETGEYQARYYYEYVEYTAKINGFTVYGDKAIIYVKRKDPTVVKEFIPVAPVGFEASLAFLFISAVILLFELVFLLG